MTVAPLLLDLPEVITTERLVIRVPLPGDGPALHEAIHETFESLHPWIPWARERPTREAAEETARRFRANFLARTDLPWFIYLADGRSFVGGIGLHRMDWAVPRFEVGYWIRTSCEGKGFMTEAVKAITRFALRDLKAHRVDLQCSHRNLRSQKVAERAGFTLEARLRNQAREFTGELRDTLLYSMIPGDEAAKALVV
jgi:RimJ/RimL family protein N-acetyltransferase